MKTSLMFIAALSLGTAAVAQSSSTMQPADPAPAPTTAPTTPDASAPATTAPTPGDSTMSTPSTAAPADTSTNTSMPATSAPTTDSAPQPATTDYPVCSRSVTDKCIQKGAAHKMHRK